MPIVTLPEEQACILKSSGFFLYYAHQGNGALEDLVWLSSRTSCSLISPPTGVKRLLLFMVRMALHETNFSSPSGAEPCRVRGMGC